LLTVLLLDPVEPRRRRLQSHLSHRFRVLACAEPGAARTFARSEQPHALLANDYQTQATGARFLLSVSQLPQRKVTVLYGCEAAGRSSNATDKFNAVVPGHPDPAVLEAIVWDQMVRLHGLEDDGAASENWRELLAEEPSLGPVQQVIAELPREHPSWQQLKELLHTDLLPKKSPEPTPERVHRVGLLFVETDDKRRQAITDQLQGRMEPLYCKHVADVRALLMRHKLSAVVVRPPLRSRFRPGWVARLRRDALDPDFAVIVHGAGKRTPIEGADLWVPQELPTEVLEVTLWEQMLRYQKAHPPSERRPVVSATVATARRTQEEVQAEYTWGELLNAEANLQHLQLLLKRHIGPAPVSEPAPDDLRGLLRAEATLENFKRLMTYEVRLTGEA